LNKISDSSLLQNAVQAYFTVFSHLFLVERKYQFCFCTGSSTISKSDSHSSGEWKNRLYL